VLSASADIASNLARVADAIGEAAIRAGRRPEEITLVGVSKTRPAAAVVAAIQAGLRHVGENRVQEAAPKLEEVRAALGGTTFTAHMIGHLQTNKVNAALQSFECIDSVDSLHLAQAIGSRRHGQPDAPVLLEVYVGDDPSRPGIRPDALIEVAGQVLAVPGTRVEGLMTVAPLGGDARQAFGRVRELKVRLSETYPRVHFGVLSMGMSEDFAVAIEEGSTEVRIGTALFGARR
jgi:pyridoxal phosphate enzyme (YggS family)